MITVRLYGSLAQFGTRYDLHAASPAEALHALFVQIRGLRRKVADGLFQVRFQGRDWGEDELAEGFGRPAAGVLHIVPRTAGAGKNGGILQTIAGIALIVVGAIYGNGPLIQAGAGLLLGGVAQMLTKQPRLEQGRGAESSRNTSFSNFDNTAAHGRPVPLAYGLVYAGSRVASQGVRTRRLSGSTAAADPQAAVLAVKKTFVSGEAATAPNGQKYNTDFADDSVRARNYTAELAKE